MAKRKPKKEELRIWKYRNGDYVSYYLRFETNEGKHGVHLLNDVELKSLGLGK